ncbi:MAG: hypothetical protein UY62_C0059G0004 [Parcubacteria group bacterium GW2011_GWF2_50_9]|nr:MAG: hypothetical protein UY62_C0059G0004 [Parcubacteria group bacterium GW2011_GWF2_50_9]
MHPRQHNRTERALDVLNSRTPISALHEDQYHLFLFKKTERLVAAVYLVTHSFNDSEPLKWNMRASSSRLLECVLSLRAHNIVQDIPSFQDLYSEMTRLLSILNLSHIADLVSPMNFSLLKGEIENLIALFEGGWRISTPPTYSLPFTNAFFGIPGDILLHETKIRHKTPTQGDLTGEAGHETNATLHSVAEFDKFHRDQRNTSKGQQYVKDSVLDKVAEALEEKGQKHKDKSQSTFFRNREKVKESRRQEIVSILRDRNSATVRDFSVSIQGCSEKTIQRILIEMVQHGVLKISGKRRWSRYSIAEDYKPS